MTQEPEANHAAPPERARIESSPPAHKLDALPLLYLLGFVILASSLVYVWRHPGNGAEQREVQRVDGLRQEMEARRRDASALAAKVAALEARPAPAAPDFGPLEARIKALEARREPDLRPLEAKLAGLEARPLPVPVDLRPLGARLDALEARKPTDLGPLEGRVAAVENRRPVDLGPLEGRAGALEAKAGALERGGAQMASRLDSVDAELAARITTLDGRVNAADAQGRANAAALAGVAERAQRARRVASAATALEGGQRLGDIPGAPAAIARFARDNPPTESGLRLSFDAAADAAHRASQPAITDGKPLLDRMWTRAQQSVTVRQGDRVLVGDPVAGVLAGARQALDAGDLVGAVKALNGGLAGPAKAAMVDWINRAQSLLDARAALAEMAAG